MYIKKGEEWFGENILDRVGAFQALFLILAVAAIFASQGAILLENINLVFRLVIPVMLFFTINFSLAGLINNEPFSLILY